MSGLSDSSSYPTGELQQHHNLKLRPLVIKRERFSSCHCSKMVKLASLGLLVCLLILLVTIAVYADPQGEAGQPKPRIRSKLSAIRKKKPNLSKEKLTTPTPAIDEVVDPPSNELRPGLTSAELSTSEVNLIETTSQPPKVKKLSVRAPNNVPPRTGPVPADCGECDMEECSTPADRTCATGLVMDRCSCCYVCGAGEGHRCYNSTLSLPYNPDVGICGAGMSCLLRNDLEPNEPREALCECRDRRVVCGSDGITYLSECKLREAAHSKPGLIVGAWSPCVSAPVMTTPVENVTVPSGEDVSMSCEVRGFPAPILHWEFLAEGANGEPHILPGDDSGVVVVVRGGPEQMMTTSWIQIIAVSPRRQGSYFCVAKNAVGSAQSTADVRVYKNNENDE